MLISRSALPHPLSSSSLPAASAGTLRGGSPWRVSCVSSVQLRRCWTPGRGTWCSQLSVTRPTRRPLVTRRDVTLRMTPPPGSSRGWSVTSSSPPLAELARRSDGTGCISACTPAAAAAAAATAATVYALLLDDESWSDWRETAAVASCSAAAAAADSPR